MNQFAHAQLQCGTGWIAVFHPIVRFGCECQILRFTSNTSCHTASTARPFLHTRFKHMHLLGCRAFTASITRIGPLESEIHIRSTLTLNARFVWICHGKTGWHINRIDAKNQVIGCGRLPLPTCSNSNNIP